MLLSQNIALNSKIGGNWWITFVVITLVLLGVRRLSLDSEDLSPIPFRKMPFKTQKQNKNYLLTPNRQYQIELSEFEKDRACCAVTACLGSTNNFRFNFFVLLCHKKHLSERYG